MARAVVKSRVIGLALLAIVGGCQDCDDAVRQRVAEMRQEPSVQAMMKAPRLPSPVFAPPLANVSTITAYGRVRLRGIEGVNLDGPATLSKVTLEDGAEILVRFLVASEYMALNARSPMTLNLPDCCKPAIESDAKVRGQDPYSWTVAVLSAATSDANDPASAVRFAYTRTIGERMSRGWCTATVDAGPVAMWFGYNRDQEPVSYAEVFMPQDRVLQLRVAGGQVGRSDQLLLSVIAGLEVVD